MSPTVSQPRTTTETPTATETTRGHWLGAVVDGIIAGIVMGIVMAVMMPGLLSEAIPALYGMDGALFGVTAHLAHSAVFGVLFAAIVRFGNLWRYTDRIASSTGLGVAYGLGLWLIAASIVMPLWMNAVGMDAVVPTFDITSMGAHVVYGAVLGALFPYLKRY